MSAQTTIVGRWGEAQVANWLKKRGYTLLASGFRCRMGEIDLIARDGDTVVFAEVKARKAGTSRFGRPCEAVDGKKQQHLRMAAEQWLSESGWTGFCRFDVLEVFLNDGSTEPDINHMKNAF